MGQFRCSHCGLKAYSKNPMTRNVFPSMDDLGSTVVQATMSFKVEPDQYREGSNDLVLRMTMAKDWNTREKAIEHLHELMRELSLEDLRKGTCSHTWEPVNGPQDYEV